MFYCEIISGLWVGDIDIMLHKKFIKENNINIIIHCTQQIAFPEVDFDFTKKNNYTEMDDIQLIPLDDVKKSLLNFKNIINLHKCNILKINKTEFYLSKRLYSFMNMKFNNGTGLDLCYQVFNNCFKQ